MAKKKEKLSPCKAKKHCCKLGYVDNDFASGNMPDLMSIAEPGDGQAIGMAVENAGLPLRDSILRAAHKGHANAQLVFGVMCYKGEMVEQDFHAAYKWLDLAADQGCSVAQFICGMMCHIGIGVMQDDATAFNWFRQAAEQGDVAAQFKMGGLCEQGLGTERDLQFAFYWYSRAAENGDALAQSKLGLMYARGEGVGQNHLYAYMWASISQEHGSEMGDEIMEVVAAQIEPDQIKKAKKLAAKCKAKKYRGCCNFFN